MVCSVADMLWHKIDKLSVEVREFKTEMKQQINKNISKMKEVIVILKEKNINAANNEIAVEDLSVLPDFPLSSREEYVEFNDRLCKDEAARKCFVSIKS